MKCNTWIRAVAGLGDRAAVYAILALLLGASQAGHSFAQESAKDLPIDKTVRTRVIEAVARYTEDNYVFPDRGREVARAIRRSYKHGDYNDIVSAD